MSIWTSFLDVVNGILNESGFASFFVGDGYKNLIMICCVRLTRSCNQI